MGWINQELRLKNPVNAFKLLWDSSEGGADYGMSQPADDSGLPAGPASSDGGGGGDSPPIGTPSPSGTGMAWSGTGWTDPSNIGPTNGGSSPGNNNPVGSPEWYTAEIASREAAAKANTETNPTNPIGSPAWWNREIAEREGIARANTLPSIKPADFLATVEQIRQTSQLTPELMEQYYPVKYNEGRSDAGKTMALPGPMGLTVTSLNPMRPLDLPGPFGTTVLGLQGVYKNPSPAEPVGRFSPANNGGFMDAIGFGMFAVGTEMSKNTNDFYMQVLNLMPSNQLTEPVKAGLGFTAVVPQTLSMIPLLGGAAYLYGKDPAWGNTQIVPSAINLGKGTVEQAIKQPSFTFGNILGMYTGGAVFESVTAPSLTRAMDFVPHPVLNIAEVPTVGGITYKSATSAFIESKLINSPFLQGVIDQAGLVDQFSSTNKGVFLSVEASRIMNPRVVAGMGYGAEITPRGFIGTRGLIDTFENVGGQLQREGAKYAPFELTNGQKLVQSLVFEPSADPFTKSIMTLNRDLAITDATLKYPTVGALLQGTTLQIGATHESNIGLHMALGAAKDQAIVVGSGGRPDYWGPDFTRNSILPIFNRGQVVSRGSDLDLSVGQAVMKDLRDSLLVAYSGTPIRPGRNTLWDADLVPKMGELSIDRLLPKEISPPEKRGFSFGIPGEEHTLGTHPLEFNADITGMPVANIAGLHTWIQTPTDAIRTKASRVFGAGSVGEKPMTFVNIPGKGTHHTGLTGSKPATDLIDIYVESRGLAYLAYKQAQYALGNRWETRSDLIAKHLDTMGEDVSKYIKEDMLLGLPRGPADIGLVSGLGLHVGNTPSKNENYPGQLYEKPSGVSLMGLATAGSTLLQYPFAGIPNTQNARYPTTSIADISYPGIGLRPNPQNMYPGQLTYPAGGYPFLNVYPDNTTYLTGTYPERLSYPDKTPYPDRITYLDRITYPAGGYPTNKLPYPVPRVWPWEDHPSTTHLHKKKYKPKPSIMFREILPIITPLEEMSGFKQGKPFFRAIGNQQILKVTPQNRDYLHWVDVDMDTRELQQKDNQNRVSDMTGMFFRTTTKAEKAKTGKPIMSYNPTQQELNMARLTGIKSNKKKGRKSSWF
jgi:hypothetical protein